MSRYFSASVFYIVACLISGQAVADDRAQSCIFAAEPLVANYTVVSRYLHAAIGSGSNSSIKFSLWREGNRSARAAHSYAEINQSEVWNRLPNGLLRVVKHFDAHARAIEYESIDSNNARENNTWISKYHLVPDALYDQILNKEIAPSVSSNNCELEQSYHDLQQRIRYDVVWNTQYQLPVSLTVLSASANGTVMTLWNLHSIEDNNREVALQFDKWDSHSTIDFADIGDNEHDPFIRKMINLGFLSDGASGFYDSSGRAHFNGHLH